MVNLRDLEVIFIKNKLKNLLSLLIVRMAEMKYAYWREDKPKEEGYSHELIST